MQAISFHLVLFYLLERFVYRVFEFFRRWYFLAGKEIVHAAIRRLASLDRKFALKITFIHFFVPLYGDESFIGRILGVIFRSIRIVTALVVYFFVIAGAFAAYAVWVFIPVFLVAKIIGL